MEDTEAEERIELGNVHWYDIPRWGLFQWLLFAALAVFVFALVSFFWADKSRFHLDSPIEFNKFGTFGDFVGGVIGTVFAFLNIRLLIQTLDLQNKANTQSEKSYTYVQKTENVRTLDTQINSLLSLYNSIVKSFSFHGDNGKKGLETVVRSILLDSTTTENAGFGDEKAIKAFEKVYASLRDKLAVYFRVIYRMLSVLRQADIDDKVRYNYAKMLRSQFTESELFLLRYNALTYNGRNMQEHILAFNLMKHLPMSKLYDLNPYFSHLDNDFSNHIDIMLYDFRKELEATFVHGIHLDETVTFQTNISNLTLTYKVFPDRRHLDVVFQVDRTSRLDDDKIEKAIAGYSDIEIAKFIIFCLRELFSKSMFQIYTKVEELKFKDFRRDKGFGLSMYLDCQEKNRMLILTKKQIDRPMPISFVPLAFCMPTSKK